jgi:hypothetical protein
MVVVGLTVVVGPGLVVVVVALIVVDVVVGAAVVGVAHPATA